DERLAGDTTRGVVGHDGVKDSVGDLVGDLVRVALGDRLGREQVLVVVQLAHGISKNSSAVVSFSSRWMTALAARTGRRSSAVNPVCSRSARSWRTSKKPSDSACGGIWGIAERNAGLAVTRAPPRVRKAPT